MVKGVAKLPKTIAQLYLQVMDFSFLDSETLVQDSKKYTKSATDTSGLNHKDPMDILGDTSDFEIIDLRTSNEDQTNNIKESGSSNATDPIEADLLFMNVSKETNPFLKGSVDQFQEVPTNRQTIMTHNSIGESSDIHKNDDLFSNKEVREEECVEDLSTNETGGMTDIQQDVNDLIAEWDLFEMNKELTATTGEASSTVLPTLNSYFSHSEDKEDTRKEYTLDSTRMETRISGGKEEKRSNLGVNIKNGTSGNEDTKRNVQEKGKGRVTFGGVHRSYYSDLGTSSIEVAFGDEVLLYKKYIKVQEEQASSLRKIAKLEKQLEEALSKKSELQSELLHSDRKMSKLETREEVFVEKERRFRIVLNKYRDDANKYKEEAVKSERKAARLERMLDEVNDQRRKDQEELEDAKKNVSRLEARFRSIERDLEVNQSVNLRNMRELSGSTAKLEREREENAELRVAIECLQDKIKNTEEIANGAMREKAAIQGELSEIRSEVEKWKSDAKLVKVKNDETVALVDRYRVQYQEQKDVLENVMKSRKQLENELQENMLLAEKREAQNKEHLQRINYLEELLYNIRQEEENKKYKTMLELELKRKMFDKHSSNKEIFNESTLDRVFTSETRVDNLVTLNEELRSKLLSLEEENRALQFDLRSFKSKYDDVYGKTESHDNEKRMLEKEIELQEIEKESMQRQMKELRVYIGHLLDLKVADGPPRDQGTSFRGNQEGPLDKMWSSRSQSEVGYYPSAPDFLNSTYTKYTGDKSPKRYSSNVERVSSMPDLHISRDSDTDNTHYTGYPRDRNRRNTYRITDYSSGERGREGHLDWRSSLHSKSKYSTYQKPSKYYLPNNRWKRESKDDLQTTSTWDRTNSTNQYGRTPRYSHLRTGSSHLERVPKLRVEDKSTNVVKRPSSEFKDNISAIATSSLKGSSSTGNTVLDVGTQGRASVTFKEDDEVFAARDRTSSNLDQPDSDEKLERSAPKALSAE